jgi:hypothetical protein
MSPEAWSFFAYGVMALMAVSMVLGVRAVARGTKHQTGFGLPTKATTHCPHCGTGLPQVRIPTSLRQAMWGGYTCGTCRIELDKWGRPIDASDLPSK